MLFPLEEMCPTQVLENLTHAKLIKVLGRNRIDDDLNDHIIFNKPRKDDEEYPIDFKI